MRQMISGLVAALAVMAAGAAPAMACGETPCGQVYIPAPVYSGCDTGCGGWAYERLPDPVQQYYYVDQGPTYSGPGDFAPYPVYREGTVYGWHGYRHHPYYYGYRGRAHFHHWHAYHGYYGYPGHHRGYYAPHVSHHYGYGYHRHTLRRYY
jgi:hypothetical protein